MKSNYVKAFINDGTSNEPIPVYVLSMEEGNEVIVNVKMEDKDPDQVTEEVSRRFYEGKLVEIGIAKGGMGVSLYTAKVSYILRERLHLEILSFQQTLQRRKDAKARFSEKGTIFCMFPCEMEEFPITFRDISTGGVGFFADETYEKYLVLNQTYNTVFTRSEPHLSLNFELLWITPLDDGRINCGGRFIQSSPSQEVAIRKFVFDQEREERRRMKEEIEREELMAELAAEAKLKGQEA